MTLRKMSLGLIISLLVVLITTTVHAQAIDIPDGAIGESYYVGFPVDIEVDGSFDDWSNIPTQTVTTGPIVPDNPNSQGSFQFSVASDFEYLYLLVQVEDQHIVANQHGEEYWFEDSIEIYINATENLSITSYQPGVAQISIPAANMGLPVGQTITVGINNEGIDTQAIVTQTPNGYVAEVAIPLQTTIWAIEPRHDLRVGFNLQLNSASQQDRDLKLSWSNNDKQADVSYQNPSVFGELIFFQAISQLPPPRPTVTPLPPATVSPVPLPTETLAQPTAEEPATDIPNVPTSAAPGADFTVAGSTILDPNGNVFVPKGVNVSGYNWVWDRSTVADADLIVGCWNFNTVRVNSFLFTGQVPYSQYTINNDLDEIVNVFTSRGVVVIFEGHDRIGDYYRGADLVTLVNWYVDLANRYKDNPYVWFDIMNEPGNRSGIDTEQWINMHGSVIEGIRSTGADNIIIVEGAFGGQDNPNANAEQVTESAILLYSDQILSYTGQAFENIMFSIHTYDLWNQGDTKLGNFFDEVHARDLAIMVGEFGIFTDQDTFAAAQSTFNTVIPRGIGRIVWHWDGSDANDLTTSGGGVAD